MSIVTYILHKGQKPTEKQKAQIRALKNRPIVPDEDCPEFTDEQWDFYDFLMEKYKTNKVTKEMVLNELDSWQQSRSGVMAN